MLYVLYLCMIVKYKRIIPNKKLGGNDTYRKNPRKKYSTLL